MQLLEVYRTMQRAVTERAWQSPEALFGQEALRSSQSCTLQYTILRRDTCGTEEKGYLTGNPSLLYGLARFLGDVEALGKGPEALAKRFIRRAAGKAMGRGSQSFSGEGNRVPWRDSGRRALF